MHTSLSTSLACAVLTLVLSGCAAGPTLESRWVYTPSLEVPPAGVPTRPVGLPVNPPETISAKQLEDQVKAASELVLQYKDLEKAVNAIARHEKRNVVVAQERTVPSLTIEISNPTNERQVVYCLNLAFRDLDPNVLAPGDCSQQPDTFRKVIDETVLGSAAQRGFVALGSQLIIPAQDTATIKVLVMNCPVPTHLRFLVRTQDVEKVNRAAGKGQGIKAWQKRGRLVVVEGEAGPDYYRDRSLANFGCEAPDTNDGQNR